jgi:DNA uptake protein ComE-like DNA-binding protein
MIGARNGFVLVAVIWVLAILTVLTLGFAQRVLLDQRAGALIVDRSRTQYLARGSVEYAVAEIQNRVAVQAYIEQARGLLAARQRGAPTPQPITFEEPFNLYAESANLLAAGEIFAAQEAAQGDQVSFSLEDAEARINLNSAPEELLDNIEGISFRTVNAIVRRRGASFSTDEPRPFLSVAEARDLDGISEDDWEGDGDSPGLRDLFTVFGSGRININTASEQVLRAIPEIDEAAVAAILGYRAGQDGRLETKDDRRFRSLEQLAAATGLNPDELTPITKYCAFESHYYIVKATASQRQRRVRASVAAVVHVEENKARVLAWAEGDRAAEI